MPDDALQEGFLTTRVDAVLNWARSNSLMPMPMGLACCAIEMMGSADPRYDIARFGSEAMRFSPRQADLMIVAGRVSQKMAPVVRQVWDQMPDPKYVLAMGACTITGGMFSTDSPTAVRGVDKLIPVDAYIPGCPPRPEAIIDAIIKLRKKVSNESMQERGYLKQSHQFYSTTHNMKVVPPIHDGKYLQMDTRQAPPKELMESMGMPVPQALESAEEKEEADRG